MKHFSSKPLLAISSSMALIVFAAFTVSRGGIDLKAQDAPKQDAAKQSPGAPNGAAKGKGRAPVDTLGAGPWDLKSELANVHITVVSKGLDHPWGMAFLPNGDMLVTERPGRLRLVHDAVHSGVLDPTPLGPLPELRATGLGGLFDIALHPKFAQNHLIY